MLCRAVIKRPSSAEVMLQRGAGASGCQTLDPGRAFLLAHRAYTIHLIRGLKPVPVIARWLKGSTAREARRIPGRPRGQPWQDGSYDRQ